MRTLFALVMLALAAGAYGQTLKCVSKDGKVEYGQSCPSGSTEQKLRSSTGTAPPGAASPSAPAPQQKSLAERDAEFKKRQIEQQEAQQKDSKKTAEDAQRMEACMSAKGYLSSLEGGMRMKRVDPKTGESVFIGDDERDSETARARARVAENCK